MPSQYQAIELQSEEADAFFERGKNGWYEPCGLFYIREGEKFIGIDNTTREAWTEEFEDFDSCLAWLYRKRMSKKFRRIYGKTGKVRT